jgi:hypothetical protein
MAAETPDPTTALPAAASDEPLPLDDPRWVLLDIPFHGLVKRVGHRDVAAHDLTKVLAMPPLDGVRSMVRWWPYEKRELLPFSYWATHYPDWDNRRNRIRVWPCRPLGGIGPNGPIHEDVHYAWKPDLMRVWPEMFPPVSGKEARFITTSMSGIAATAASNSSAPESRPFPKSIAKKLAGNRQMLRAAYALWQEFPPAGKTPRSLSVRRCRTRLASHWEADNEEFGLTDPSEDVVGKAMNLFGRTRG